MIITQYSFFYLHVCAHVCVCTPCTMVCIGQKATLEKLAHPVVESRQWTPVVRFVQQAFLPCCRRVFFLGGGGVPAWGLIKKKTGRHLLAFLLGAVSSDSLLDSPRVPVAVLTCAQLAVSSQLCLSQLQLQALLITAQRHLEQVFQSTKAV